MNKYCEICQKTYTTTLDYCPNHNYKNYAIKDIENILNDMVNNAKDAYPYMKNCRDLLEAITLYKESAEKLKLKVKVTDE